MNRLEVTIRGICSSFTLTLETPKEEHCKESPPKEEHCKESPPKEEHRNESPTKEEHYKESPPKDALVLIMIKNGKGAQPYLSIN